jgi:ribosomal protein S7
LLDTFVFLKTKLNDSPLKIFGIILQKIKPLVELKNLKIGSSKYLIPTPLTLTRQLFLGLIF